MSVVSVPFAPAVVAAPETQKTDIVNVMQNVQRPFLGIVGLALIIVVALLSLKSLKSMPGGQPQVMSLPRNDGGMQPPMLAHQPNIPVVMPTNTMRDRVNSTIEQQPDVATRVVRAWLKEA